MLELVLATRNEGKILELKSLLSDLPLTILTLKDLPGSPQVVEDGEDYQANAVIKAREIAKWSGRLALADDSGLEIDYLNAAPGVRSARFGGETATSAQKNALILRLLGDIPRRRRGARFRCVVAVATPQGDSETVSGSCSGYIGNGPRGKEGFGYDPIFMIPAYDMTMAQISRETKNRISHRALALKAAKTILVKHIPS